MAKNGKCKAGYYYCYTDEKCKPIPKGFKMVGRAGYLRKENGHSVDDDDNKNGNGSNGNGNGSNGNGNGNGSNGNGNGGGVSESKSGDSSLRDWFGKSKSSDGKPGWVQLGGKYSGKPCAKQPGQTTKPKCGSSKMKRNLSKDEEQAAFRRKNTKDPNPNRSGKAINVKTEETILEKDMLDKQGNDKFDRYKRMIRHKQDKHGRASVMDKIKTGKDYKEETVIEKAGEKDACYHKVKSRYSVWPSAYASGALVKCRKKGAANWGNKTKKEEFSNWRDDFKATEYEFIDLIAPEPLQPTEGIGSKMLDEKHDTPKNVKGIAKELDKAVEMHKSQAKRLRKAGISEDNLDEKCWKGYTKKGMKTMFGKRYPNCVKKEEVEQIDEKKGCMHNHKGEECPVHGAKECPALRESR